MQPEVIFLICAIALVFVSFIIWICSRYKKCPSDKIMVVYGSIGKNKDGTNRSAKCIHGGAEFVIPVFQSYSYLDLTPISIQVDLKNALSRQNIRIDVPQMDGAALQGSFDSHRIQPCGHRRPRGTSGGIIFTSD